MKNKLSYLGFLGFLGFAGFLGEPLLFSFFSNLVFFAYRTVTPDELFWQNVKTCASRAFFVYFVLSNLLVVSITVLNRMGFEWVNRFAITGFAAVMVASLLVFFLSLTLREFSENLGMEEVTAADED